jgi:hypothetical protein
MYVFLADLLVAIHLVYVGYVVVGQLLILLGMVFKWQWIRNPWFRWTHLLMILIVVGESVANFQCPLTVWEVDLRRMAGEQVEDRTFIGWLLGSILFFENVPFNHWGFRVGYISFGVLVLLSFILAPPRWPRWRKSALADPVADDQKPGLVEKPG